MAGLSLKKISDFVRRKVEENPIIQFALRKALEAKIRPLFNQLRLDMIQELHDHPISEEIALGPKLNWSSPFLNGYGDLFSFIGFQKDDNPIKPIEDLFKGLRLYSITSKGLKYKFEIKNFPTQEDIRKVTKMPWATGRSWAMGIEEGISGLGRYLNIDYDKGRSGAGIQAKNIKNLRPAFQPTPYITPILKKYRAKFTQIAYVKLSGIIK